MADYRHKETGDVKSQGEWRREHQSMSLPRVWNQSTLEALNLEAVLEAPKPTVGQYQTAVKNGAEKDAKGNWVTAWAVRDMFADDEDGTKAEKEAAYQAKLDADAAAAVRTQRDKLLAETDWVVIMHTEKGTNIPALMELYRQALRDISAHANFPHLEEADWPEKPA